MNDIHLTAHPVRGLKDRTRWVSVRWGCYNNTVATLLSQGPWAQAVREPSSALCSWVLLIFPRNTHQCGLGVPVSNCTCLLGVCEGGYWCTAQDWRGEWTDGSPSAEGSCGRTHQRGGEKRALPGVQGPSWWWTSWSEGNHEARDELSFGHMDFEKLGDIRTEMSRRSCT